MAGRGPAPKDPSRRVRRGSSYEQTVIGFKPAEQPALPEGFPWPDETVAWWSMLRSEPIAALLTAADWEFLLQTALLHADYWSGNLERASELRIRLKDFGITLTGRASLRLQFAEADDADAKRPERVDATQHYANVRPLRAVADAVEA